MHQPAINPDFGFLEMVEAAGPFNAAECFQCRKCTNGCPASFEMDLYPDQVIRLAVLGQKEEVLRSKTIWVCASCETCSTRCPNGVRIAELMDYFKQLAVREGVTPARPEILALHRTFLENVAFTGRVFEGAILPVFVLRSGQVFKMVESGGVRKEIRMALNLYRKGRLAMKPTVLLGKDEVRNILRSSKKTGPRI